MPSTIDQRVVEMEFDNGKFESNVKTTLSTIEKLKKSLNFSGAEKGLEEIEKTSGDLNFDGMSKGLEKVQNGFSALEVIAISALSTITTHLTNAGLALARSLSIDQVTAGWSKYEQKTSSVATLINNATSALDGQAVTMEIVNDELEKLNWFTDETSYNFVDMVGNMGKLTSQNIPLEKANLIMMGIADATALAGQNAAAASRVMYNVAQAYGQGALKLMDWRSLENANVVTAELKQTMLDTAVSVGTLTKSADGLYKTAQGIEVTVSNFSSTLAEGWLNTDVMSGAFESYSKFGYRLKDVTDEVNLSATEFLQGMDAFSKGKNSSAFQQWSKSASESLEKVGLTIDDIIPYMEELSGAEYTLGQKAFRAAQEARTLSDAIDAIKDGVSTAWMNVFETIFGGYDKAKVLWTNIANAGYDVFAEPVNALNEGLQNVFNFGTSMAEQDWLGLGEGIKDSEAFQKVLRDTASEHGYDVGKMIKDNGSFIGSLKEGWLSYDILDESIKKYEEDIKVIAKETGQDVDSLTSNLDKFKSTALEVLRADWGRGHRRRDLLTEAGYDPELIQTMTDEFRETGDVSEDTRNKITEMSKSIIEMSEEELKNAGISKEASEEAKKLYKAMTEDEGELKNLLKVLQERSGREVIIQSFKNIGAAISSVFGPLKASLSNIFPSLGVKEIYDHIVAFEKFTKSLILTEEQSEKLRKTFDGLTSIIGIGLDVVKKFSSGAVKIVKALAEGIIDITGEADLLSFTAKIGEALVKFRKWLDESFKLDDVITIFTNNIKTWTTSIKNWISAFKNSDSVNNALNSFLGIINKIKTVKIEDVFNSIKNGVSVAFNAIKNFFKSIKENGIDKALIKAQTDLNNFKNFIDQKLTSIKNVFSNLWNGIVETFNQFGVDIQPAIDFIKKVFNKFKEILSRFNLGNTISAAIGIASLIGIIKTIGKAIKLFKSIGRIIDSLSGILDGLSNVLDGVSKKLKAKAFKKTSDGILQLAFSVAIVAASMALLAFIPEKGMEQARKSIIAIAIAMGVLAGVVFALSKYGLNGGKVETSILTLAASLLIIAYALKMVSEIGIGENKLPLGQSLFYILGALAIIVIFAGILGKYVPKLSANSLMIVSMALAVLAIAKALTMVGNLNPESIKQAGKTMALTLLAMTGIALVIGAFYLNFSQMAGVIALAAGIYSVAKVLTKIVKISENLEIKDADKLTKVAIAIFGAAVVMAAISRLAGPNAAKGGIGILAMVTALLMLRKLVDSLSNYTIKDFEKIQPILEKVANIFLTFMAISWLAGDNILKAGAAFILMAAAIGLLAIVIIGLAKLKGNGLGEATACVIGLGLMFAVMMYTARFAQKSTKAIVAMAAAIVAIGVVVGILSFIPFKQLMPVVVGLTLVMAAMALMMYTAGIAGYAGGKALVAIGLMVVVLAAIGAALYLLTTYTDVDAGLKAAISLTALMLGMAVLLGVCGFVGQFGITAVAQGVGGLLVLLIALAAIGAAAVLMSDEIPDDFEDKMDKAIRFMQKCGELVGAVIGGIAVGISDGFGDIGENLSIFMENLQPFIDGMKNIDNDTAEKIQILMDAIKKLSNASVWNGLSKIFGGEGSIVKMGKDLSSFASSISDLTSINGEALDNALNAISKVSSVMSEAPTTGGIKSWWNGDNNLANFGRQLSNFAEYITPFLSIDMSNVSYVTDGVSQIASNLGNLEVSDGTQSFINSINEVTNSIAEYSQIMNDFGTTVGESFSDGLKNGLKISSTVRSALAAGVSSLRGYYTSFYNAGSYVGQGAVNGLDSMIESVRGKGKEMGQAAIDGFNLGAVIRSPSHKAYASGVFVGKGAVNGMNSMLASVYGAGENLGNASVDSFSNAVKQISRIIESDIDVTPTITPVLNLSNIQNGVDEVNSLINGSKMSISGTIDRARSAYTLDEDLGYSKPQTASGGTVNNFVQNNYSPKALNRIDIYRQTKNLINSKA